MSKITQVVSRLRDCGAKKIGQVSLSIVLATTMVISSSVKCGAIQLYSRKFTDSQQKNAEVIAEICNKEWKNYGVLPSIAIAQAFVESTLGDHCRGYNLWGICSGGVTYSSLENGVYGYLKVINNGYYKDAPFQTDYKIQIRKILDGGYCQPEGEYYSKVLWTVKTYNLEQYDQKLFTELKKQSKEERHRVKKQVKSHINYMRELAVDRSTEYERERIKSQYKKYEFVYDPSLREGQVSVDIDIIYGGAVLVYKDLEMIGIYDAVAGHIEGYKLGTSDKSLVGKKVYIDVHEEAVG